MPSSVLITPFVNIAYTNQGSLSQCIPRGTVSPVLSVLTDVLILTLPVFICVNGLIAQILSVAESKCNARALPLTSLTISALFCAPLKFQADISETEL